MVHRRSAESIESRKAKFFCLKNSTYDRKLQERVFLGNEEDMRFYVTLTIPRPSEKRIPSCPKGLVMNDNRARGAFDIDPEIEVKRRFIDD